MFRSPAVAVDGRSSLASVDELLAAPHIDGLLADVQIGGDLSDPPPSSDQIENLGRNSAGYLFGALAPARAARQGSARAAEGETPKRPAAEAPVTLE